MSDPIESHLQEDRQFSPPIEFALRARIGSMDEYEALRQQSIDDPDTFWAHQARELTWQQEWDQVCRWKPATDSAPPEVTWFDGAKLNVAENCLDRHIREGRGNKPAILFEGEPGDSETISYAELKERVCRFANVLKEQSVKAGDRVLIYLPMIPQAVVAMLACARIGAIHSVVFGGFSADSIKDRLADSGAEVIVTADGGWRRGKVVPLKANVDEAIAGNDKIRSVIVCNRCDSEISLQTGRDHRWEELEATVEADCPAEALDAEHPLFILYTSGSTGKPKGILHSSGGYLVGAYTTTKYVFDLHPDDVYWCTADVGWITGHSYIVYGPLANGATQVIYEGAPNQPDFSRFWQIIEKYKVSIFYTAPTAIRAFIKAGDEFVEGHDLSSLRLLGSVGEPINPEAWIWYHQRIGGGRCPIVDTWWQTETGAIMISPLPGATILKPGTCTLPFFGVDAAIVDETGVECGPNEGGKLVIRKPWPSMLRGIWGDPERFRETYWAEYAEQGYYLAGDGARRDDDGFFWIVGRLDDVLNVSGHRLGTAEVESALVAHPAVAEAAVVGRPDDLKGQAVVCFVTVRSGVETSEELAAELRNHVGKVIGAIAKPDEVRFAAALPKTRSGKIMRRLLKEICATGKISGDITTLDDMQAVAALQGKGAD